MTLTTYATTRAVSRKAGRNRIVVGDVDVTNFRGTPTTFPSYTLTEPFAYGATSLTFPQIHGGYERAGLGELSWARQGARVVLSRVFDDDSETIDYVGRVISIEPQGRALQLDIGGEFSGPANLLGEQNQLVRSSIDVGRWASLAAGRVGLSFSPWFGPETGIEITHAGGQSLLSWAQYVCSMSQDDTGAQRAIMPTAWGSTTWQFEPKDYTTVHLTAFNDDARVVLSVVDDASEQPNVIYGTGVDPDGVRWANGKWPHVFEGAAPDYPIAGGGSFGVGTTDADTVNGDGIEVLYYALRELSYLPFQIQFTGVYTTDIGAAVQRFKKDVGLTVNTTMTQNAWNRLFDVDATGMRLNGAKVFPLAYDPRVEPYLYTANGLIVGRNPAYDPTVLRVERTVDFGAGITKANARRYAQGLVARSLSLKNWVGTVRFNLGAFTGDRSASDRDALTGDDMMVPRDVRPGMNMLVPDFDGGTLFHIAGCDVAADGVTATIDTQARDLVEVREILARNADSRRDIRREWMVANRGARPSHNMVSRDENFGRLDRNVSLNGNRWNVIPLIAGQHGQVNRVRIRLVNDEAEFAAAVFASKITEKRLNRRVGNPLVAAAESVWEKESLQDWYEDRLLLWQAGDGKQPCGYSPRRHRNDDGDLTDAPITGRLDHDEQWSYISAAHTAVIVYLAIYPDRDCTLKRGQILWAQLDDAA